MAWCKVDGSAVAMKPLTIQIEVPAEAAVNIGTPNWGAVMSAGIQLVIAMMTSNPVAIAAAIQALLAALMGS
jgi:hypothetical protein